MLAIRQWRRSACLQTILKNFARGAQTAAAISRNKDYAEIHDRDVAYFRDILGDRGVITDPDALQPVNRYSQYITAQSKRSESRHNCTGDRRPVTQGLDGQV